MRRDQRVRLVVAASSASQGGAARVVWELATRLPATRYDARVWLSRDSGADELAVSLVRGGIRVDRVHDVTSRWDWGGMLATWSRLRRAGPSLLHVHHAGPPADRFLPGLARAAGVPHVIVTEHGFERWPTRDRPRNELQRADAVTAVCAAVAEGLVRDHGIERARVRVVPNGADLPDLDQEWPAARRLRDELGVTQFRPLWVCAARLEEEKGQAVLLDALAQVRNQGNDFVAAFAGEGSLRSAFQRRAAAHALGPSVRFLGRVDPLGPLLLAADACLIPSLSDGLPLSLLDSLARGRPVVASRVGGIPDVVEDGVSGRLVPAGDSVALANVLEDFHRRPDAARRLGLEGAERVHAHYTWEGVVEAFEAVYDEVMGLASFAPAEAEVVSSGARPRPARR
jgi:glycosyltransferase involved in cell wall biosynthesis